MCVNGLNPVNCKCVKFWIPSKLLFAAEHKTSNFGKLFYGFYYTPIPKLAQLCALTAQ